jgi:hypothetical protein
MLVIVKTYLARAGEEDAVIALHEDWQHDQRSVSTRGGYHSWKLLRKEGSLGEFISMAEFADEKVAAAALQDLEKDEWYQRLVSLMAEKPTQMHYTIVWQLQ